MQRNVLIDGSAADAGWLSERGFQFGDGLFETIAISGGLPCLWRRHMLRLQRGCRRLHLPAPDPDLLSRECTALCAGSERAVLKIYWTAGDSERGYRRPQPLRPRRILQRSEWPAAPGSSWVVRSCRHRLGDNPQLAEIKHLNRLDQVIARAEWHDPAIDEGLVLGQDGRVVCGTMSNLFVQRGGVLSTPDLSRCGIAGVVRELALDLAAQCGEPVRTADLSLTDVRDADALYLTNSLVGVVRVDRFDDRQYDNAVEEHPVITHTRAACHRPDAGDEGDV